ncbi:MAG: hypothetical protein M3R15_01295, partial [Acidobacteriota bacterium]|nr:hypothetical protein [Acidobacteriota bacterium]
LTFSDITTNYRKRWEVECYHKSLKQNVSLAKSPTHTETTQTNHFFAALCGFVKLEPSKQNSARRTLMREDRHGSSRPVFDLRSTFLRLANRGGLSVHYRLWPEAILKWA